VGKKGGGEVTWENLWQEGVNQKKTTQRLSKRIGVVRGTGARAVKEIKGGRGSQMSSGMRGGGEGGKK